MGTEQQLELLFSISLCKILGLLCSCKFCYFRRSRVILSTFCGDYLLSKHNCSSFLFAIVSHVLQKSWAPWQRISMAHLESVSHTPETW